MLTCLLNNQRIDCYSGKFSRDELKKWASKRILLCPACGKPYEYCHGKVKTPYFRHMDKAECEDRFSESETEEHMIGKRDLYEWIKKQKYVTDCVLEGWLPETKQRPDIMFKYKGQVCVIEYQCSPIASEYIERHNLYQAAGIKDIWVAGIEKYKQPNMRHKFLEDYIEGYYDVKTKEFWIGEKTEYYKFLSNVRAIKKYHLNGMIFKDLNFIYTSHKIGFSYLEELHCKRIKEKIIDTNNEIKKNIALIKSTEKFINKFNRTYTKDPWPKSELCLEEIKEKNGWCYYISTSDGKENFYKKLFELKKEIIFNDKKYAISQRIYKYNNKIWNFSIYETHNDKIEIWVSLNGLFKCYKRITIEDFINLNEKSQETIKNLLFDIMKRCYKKGLKGNENLRIMEVRED